MRDNSERIGAKPMEGVDPPSAGVAELPSITEEVDLPSEGKYYPEDSYLRGKESVAVKFMTAAEEDILNNKTFLKKGVAIDRMLSNLIIDRNIKLDEMFTFDKNALIVAVRMSGYGSDYKTKITCPSCDFKFEFNFDLSEIKTKLGDTDVLAADGTLSFVLPKSKAEVKCRLLTGRDEKYLSQLSESKKKNKLQETPLTDQLKLLVVSVNGNSDKNYIDRFISTMPSIDSRFLRTKYAESVPSIDMSFQVECPDCEEVKEVIMPLAAEFFWPR